MGKVMIDFEKNYEVNSRKDGKFVFDRISCKVNGLTIKLGVTGTAYDALTTMLSAGKTVEIHTEVRQFDDERTGTKKDYDAIFALDADGDAIALKTDSFGKKKIVRKINQK